MRRMAVLVAAGLLALGGCSDDASDAAPQTSPSVTTSPTMSGTPTAGEPTEPSGEPDEPGGVATPDDFVVAGIDCGLLDQRAVPATPEPPDGFATADRCIANALRTGQAATFLLVSESAESEPVFAVFAVDGPGRLVITEDHRAVLASAIDARVKTCTEARSLTEQGNCTAVDRARTTGG